jgi:hypothetical protein
MDLGHGLAWRCRLGSDDLGTVGCGRMSGGSVQLSVSTPRQGGRAAQARSSRGGSPVTGRRRARAAEKAMSGGCRPEAPERAERAGSARAHLHLSDAELKSSPGSQARVPAGRVTKRREGETRTRRDEDETSPSRETRTRREGAGWQ